MMIKIMLYKLCYINYDDYNYTIKIMMSKIMMIKILLLKLS
jgi:hypothetical protein